MGGGGALLLLENMAKKKVGKKRKARQTKELHAADQELHTNPENKSKNDLLRNTQRYAAARSKPKVKAEVEALEGVVGSNVPKFRLRERVKKIGTQEIRTVEEIREGGGEPLYSIQLGSDFATRIWAKESELEPAGRYC
jgi:hypothetical protein